METEAISPFQRQTQHDALEENLTKKAGVGEKESGEC